MLVGEGVTRNFVDKMIWDIWVGVRMVVDKVRVCKCLCCNTLRARVRNWLRIRCGLDQFQKAVSRCGAYTYSTGPSTGAQ